MNMNSNTTAKQPAWELPTLSPELTSNRSEKDISDWGRLTAELKNIAEANGWSKAEIARKIGMADGTFSQWFSGKYAGRLDNTNAIVERFVQQQEAQASLIAAIPQSPPFFNTRTSQEIMQTLTWAQASSDFVMITVGAGNGKTATCREYRARRPNVFMIVMSPHTKTVNGMLVDLATEMGVQEHNPARYVRAIGARLSQSGGSLLVIDEAQHLVDDAINQLRHFSDNYNCGIALVGNNEIYDRIRTKQSGPSYAQLKRRIGKRLNREKPYAEDIKASIAAWKVTDENSTKLLYGIGMKGGALGQIDKTMKLASMLALGAGDPVTYDYIKAAWENRNVEDFA
jgi:DNA transposition AAA+ family ATPase